MIAAPALFAGVDGHDLGERQKNLLLALVASAGLHLIALLLLEATPGEWRVGFQPALHATLKEVRSAPDGADTTPQTRKPVASAGRSTAPRAGGSAPMAERYFRASEVDSPAVAVEQGPLVLPELAYVSRLAGTVRVRIYISEVGAIDALHVVEARPRSGIFEDAAIEALRQVRYEPARIAGRAVKSQKLVEVTFNPREDAAPR